MLNQAGQAESVKGRATSPLDDLLECLCGKLWFWAIEWAVSRRIEAPASYSIITTLQKYATSHCDILHLRVQKHNPAGSAF